MEFVKSWFGRFELKDKRMFYLLGTVFLLQFIFWWLFSLPIMTLDWIIELKFLNLFLAAFLIWIIAGKSK